MLGVDAEAITATVTRPTAHGLRRGTCIFGSAYCRSLDSSRRCLAACNGIRHREPYAWVLDMAAATTSTGRLSGMLKR